MPNLDYWVVSTQESLEHLARGFQVFPHPDEPRDPNPDEWATYLCKHAGEGYGEEKFGALALELVLEPEILTAIVDENLQKLGGALIGVTFTQNELKQLAKEGK